MAKPEWGTKRTCPSCGARFYDFDNEFPLTCPKCETAFTPDPVLKPRRARVEEEKPAEPEKEEDADDLDADDVEVDDTDDALLMPDDDDDDAADVVPIVKKGSGDE